MIKNFALILWAIIGSLVYAYLLQFNLGQFMYLVGFTFGAMGMIVGTIVDNWEHRRR